MSNSASVPQNTAGNGNTQATVDPRPLPGEHWNPARHTVAVPTDAYGCIDFRGAHTNKAQYIRYVWYLSFESRGRTAEYQISM